jgi:hypothetical protein
MTSLSVRQYVLGIFKHLGLKEKEITKVQTGGPGVLLAGLRDFFELDFNLPNSFRWRSRIKCVMMDICVSDIR